MLASLFFCLCHPLIIRPWASSSPFCPVFHLSEFLPLFILRMVRSFLQGNYSCVFHFDEVFAAVLMFPEVLSIVWGILFFSFLSLLIWWCLLLIFPSIFSKCFESSLIWQFYSFRCFFFICSFPLFIIGMTHFSILNSIPISWLYILIVFGFFLFFFFFCEQLDVVHIH